MNVKYRFLIVLLIIGIFLIYNQWPCIMTSISGFPASITHKVKNHNTKIALIYGLGSMGTGILCARLSWRIPKGLNPMQVKLSQQHATEAALVEVMKLMEPVDRRCRAATQVNVLNPGFDVIGEADSLE